MCFDPLPISFLFAGTLIYVVFINVNRNNPLTWVTPILAPIIYFILGKFMYGQAVNLNGRIDVEWNKLDKDINSQLKVVDKELRDIEKNQDDLTDSSDNEKDKNKKSKNVKQIIGES